MITSFGASPLTGRSRELGRLEAAIKTVGDGVGRIVLLEGEPGIGKTTLLGEAVESAHDLGLQVFAASAEELDQRRPFGVIVDCLGITAESSEGRRGEIARLLLEEPPPSSDRL
jgi:predicted ATPase